MMKSNHNCYHSEPAEQLTHIELAQFLPHKAPMQSQKSIRLALQLMYIF